MRNDPREAEQVHSVDGDQRKGLLESQNKPHLAAADAPTVSL